ncbi:molybdopterin-dependent oxidoreductase, partial [Fictibacillus sp. UD]
MSIFQDAILRFGRTIMSYAGDAVFLQASVSSAANVIVADGDVAEEEIESAIAGIRANPILEKSYDTLRVEQELYEAIARGKIKALWVMGTNPLVSMPRADAIRESLAGLDLYVVSEAVSDSDTARGRARTTVLLPAQAWGEKDGTVTNSERRIS